MSSPSLTKQAGSLMIGRFLSMPLAFLVPVILTRRFSVDEFGYYKQLFLIFNVLLPIIDFGVTNSLYYFMPRYPEAKSAFVGQTLILTSFLCILALAVFTFFPENLSKLFTNDSQISNYIFLLGLFAVSWHLSNLCEVVLIVEKRAMGAGIVTFLSETARSAVSITVVLLGYGLYELLVALVCVGVCRCLFTGYYLFTKYDVDWRMDMVAIKRQLFYAVPFGAAVIVNGFVANVHQYMVSVTSSAADFAVFAVGCFQLPLLMVVVDSIAKTSLVRMAELRSHENGLEEIANVISNSCRKLWLLFFPIFVLLFVTAEEFIEILFTEQYLSSVPTFRIFIFIIPLSAILIQHVPRALDRTNLILFNNIFALILSILLCWVGGRIWGIEGVAVGFVFAHLAWKIVFLVECRKILDVRMRRIIPYQEMVRTGVVFIFIGVGSYFIKDTIDENFIFSYVVTVSTFVICSSFSYLFLGILTNEERAKIISFMRAIKSKVFNVWIRL